MKKTKNCGFTLIELVIVIAVIAVLSSVLIPTFGNLIDDAQNSARDQKARNAYTDFIAYHPDEDNSYLFIEIEDGGATYYYSVADGQIDLENEVKSINAAHEDGIVCSGYIVYRTSANALWLERWNALVINGTKEVNAASIIYTDPFSSFSPNCVDSKNVKKDDISSFVEYFKKKITDFKEVSCEDEEYLTAGRCQIILAYVEDSGSDSNREKLYYYTYFTISENGYVFAITKSLTGSLFEPLHPLSYSGTVLKSEGTIDRAVIDEYFKNHTE